MTTTYKHIFSGFKFPVSGVEVDNRIVLAPMTTFSGNQDGTVSDEEIAYYKERNQTAGLLLTACAYVMRQGKGFFGQIAADSDETIPSLRRIADTLKANGNKAILQIHHAGRMSPPEELPDGQPISASAIAAERPDAATPREMTESEIMETIQAYGEAARRAIIAGFDGVEIHGANTYLIQQFFSPHSNRRTDKWGGSLEKRMTFPLAIADEVIAIVKQHADRPFIVGYRISPEEMENPGITLNDTLQLVDNLAKRKLDYLHVSTMDFRTFSIRGEEREASPTRMIHERIGHLLPVIAVGGITQPADAEDILKSGVPLVAMGRELIMEPHWLEKTANGQTERIRTVLDPAKNDELKIPNQMLKEIEARPGWIPMK